ncbi:cyclic nucleotide-binding domain-containing protein [Kribbella sp. NBC_00889]|uniref:cyclic nucleotide-binding domain-containing protein n=1 Tax=Kribbella sp. NBC_00889 TaxID=2975974 RepID=UPI00386E2F2B|nr:cyclic nucleotide-binding domain-containing protein [Kribbella sp. NBC_00889]
MSHESLPQFLAKIDLFQGLSQDTLSDLMARGTTLTIPAGQHAVEQGADDAGLQVVLEGSAEVTVHGTDRAPLGPGDYFGEISLVDGLPRSATVVAGPDGLTTFALSSLAFAPVVKENSDVAEALLKALTARIRSLEAQN